MAKQRKKQTHIIVGDGSGLSHIRVTRRADFDAANEALAAAIETDQAQLVETHMATRARLLASTQAMTAKVEEALA